MCVPLRDSRGNIRLHYALRLTQPEDFAVAQADKRDHSLNAVVHVLGENGKEIFSREQKVSKYMSKDDLDLLKGKPVAYEGWVPLVPGKYTLKFLFTNLLTKTSFPAERTITVPDITVWSFRADPHPWLQAEAANPNQAEYLPFTGGGICFRPYVAKELALVPGQDLKFFYQIWRPQPNGKSGADKKLLVDYAYGRPSFSGSAQTIHEELSTTQFDPHGSMVNGKKVDTTSLGAGNYRLSISVIDPETQQKRFSAMPFQIVSENPSPSDMWQIDDDGLADYINTGQADFDRGLIFLAKGNAQEAVNEFLETLRRDPSNERARARLADYYFEHKEFGKVVDLFARNEVTAKTEEVTILAVADSLDRTGRSSQAVSLLESALKIKPPSGPLYLALGTYYQHIGNTTQGQRPFKTKAAR